MTFFFFWQNSVFVSGQCNWNPYYHNPQEEIIYTCTGVCCKPVHFERPLKFNTGCETEHVTEGKWVVKKTTKKTKEHWNCGFFFKNVIAVSEMQNYQSPLKYVDYISDKTSKCILCFHTVQKGGFFLWRTP